MIGERSLSGLVLCALCSKGFFFLGLGARKEDIMNEGLFSYWFSTGGLDICAMFYIAVIISWCLLCLCDSTELS